MSIFKCRVKAEFLRQYQCYNWLTAKSTSTWDVCKTRVIRMFCA